MKEVYNMISHQKTISTLMIALTLTIGYTNTYSEQGLTEHKDITIADDKNTLNTPESQNTSALPEQKIPDWEQESIACIKNIPIVLNEFEDWFEQLANQNSRAKMYDLIVSFEPIVNKYNQGICEPTKHVFERYSKINTVQDLYVLISMLEEFINNEIFQELKTSYKKSFQLGEFKRAILLGQSFTKIGESVKKMAENAKKQFVVLLKDSHNNPRLKKELENVLEVITKISNTYKDADKISDIIRKKIQTEFIKNDQYRTPLKN